jgi:hypothetical protein
MQGSWIDFDKLWETVSQISECWKIYIKFRVFFFKKIVDCANFGNAQVCGRCMDRGVIIIKLPKR